MIQMALLGLAALAGGAILGVGALGSALVGHQWSPYVFRGFSPYYYPNCYGLYPYPMTYMGTGVGTGTGFYPWSPMPWFQPPLFGY